MAKRKLTLEESTALSVAKRRGLRMLAEHQFTGVDLLEIFGMAIRAKMNEPSNPHNRLGKHYLGSHGPAHHHRGTVFHPASTKLVRSFIRRSGRESVNNRNAYKMLTGQHYAGGAA